MVRRYLTTPMLCERYGRSWRTLARWIKNPPPGFPKSLLINGRHHWAEDEIEAYERSLVAIASPDRKVVEAA